jgi:hypothetical protein
MSPSQGLRIWLQLALPSQFRHCDGSLTISEGKKEFTARQAQD